MAFTSYGYDDDLIGASEWAEMISRVGSAVYGVTDFASWRVTVATGARVVSIAAGAGWGPGVFDKTSAAETLSLASVPTGLRWDLIVARRNWGTQETAFAVVQGGSAKTLPTRNTTKGTLDDQPIALVRVSAGSDAIQEIVDVRAFPGVGGMAGVDKLVLSYMSRLGSSVTIDGYRHTRVVNASGSESWMSERAHTSSADSGIISPATGFEITTRNFESRGALAQVVFGFKRTGANLPGATSGDIANTLLGTVAEWARPMMATPLSVISAGPLAAAYMYSNGQVNISAVAPGWVWAKNDELIFGATFIRIGS